MDNKTGRIEHREFSRVIMTIGILFLLTGPTIFCGGVGSPQVDIDATIAAGIAATQQAETSLQATIEAAVAATQVVNTSPGDQLPAPTVVPTPIPPTISIPDPQQVRTVILNEVSSTVAQDLSLLRSLYAPDAVVIDRNGTPDNPGDDTTWRGWANIERRYLAFFSQGVSSLTLVDLSIQMNGNQATGTHQGVVLDGTFHPLS